MMISGRIGIAAFLAITLTTAPTLAVPRAASPLYLPEDGPVEEKVICADAGDAAARKACEKMFSVLSQKKVGWPPPTPPPGDGSKKKEDAQEPQPPRVDMPIYFANGSADLDARSQRFLGSIAGMLNNAKLANQTYVIEGHTNSIGARDYNLDLSERRAQAVIGFLMAKGVSASRLQAKGLGFDAPRIRNNPADRRNRRVEVVMAGRI